MSFGEFSIVRDTADGKVRLLPSGELDFAQVDRLKEEVDRCPDGKTVSTTESTFIDSTDLAQSRVITTDSLSPVHLLTPKMNRGSR